MKTLLLTFALAQAADLGTTLVNLDNGCRELNPIYRGTTPELVTKKVVISFGIGGYSAWLHKKDKKRLAKIIIWTGIGAGFGAAAWNTHIMPQCGK